MSSAYQDILERVSTNSTRIDEILEKLSTNSTRIDEFLVVVQQIKEKLDKDACQQNLPALVNPAFQIDENNIEESTNHGKFFQFVLTMYLRGPWD